jgi:Gas vesicle synthesis protein GvpO
VVELSRIPESTDVLALYEMELDDDRNLMRYDRVRRYYRSQADRGDHT